MENLPIYIPVVFITTTVLTLFLLYKSSRSSRSIAIIVLLWLAIQAAIGLSGFYLDTHATPPRFGIAIIIPVLTIMIMQANRKSRAMLDNWDLKWLTGLHAVRVLVELVLYWLFVHKQVPKLMTFEGINYDILSGITAPIMVWLCFGQQKVRRIPLLIWNVVCLGLLFNIVIHAVLSAPLPFQQMAFDQPNVAVLYFPYVWLPAFIVPAVLLSHVVAIRRLMVKNKPSGQAAQSGQTSQQKDLADLIVKR